MMDKVYVPQVPSRYDSKIKCWVPTVNLDPAKQFGLLEPMLPPEAGRMAPDELKQILSKSIEDITEADWILATGDPVVMGIVMVMAARKLGGLLRILRWDKRTKSYEPIELKV